MEGKARSNPDGTLATTLDVPMQGATGVPVEKTTFENSELSLEMAALQAKFNGKAVNQETIEGNFEQAGMKLPLTLKKFESKLPGNPALVSSEAE